MAPNQYYIQLQRGIVGGFAPPTPDAIHRLTRAIDDPTNISIESFVRLHGTPDLIPHPPKKKEHDDHDGDVTELVAILKELPTEDPPGSEDIYGLNTGIAFGSDELEWVNGGPQGCGDGFSTRKATDEQKAKFERAVEIVKGIVGDSY